MSADTTKCCSTFRVVQITFVFRVFSASGRGGEEILAPFLILQFAFTLVHKSGRVVRLLLCVIVNTNHIYSKKGEEGGGFGRYVVTVQHDTLKVKIRT